MKKALVLYSGQGSQFAGLGLDFYATYPAFKKSIDTATEVTGLEVLKILEHCQQAATKELQVALTAYSIGVYNCLCHEHVVKVKGALGLSLGEYPALITSGALDFYAGLKLVQKRAKLMHKEAKVHTGALLAVLAPDLQEIKRLLQKYNTPNEKIWFANYNAPKQVVLGGGKKDLVQFQQELKELGKKAIMLNVAGAFHTPLFAQTSNALKAEMAQCTFQEPCFPVFSNTTGSAFTKENIPEILVQQVMQPTYFEKCLYKMLAQEKPDILLEIGPGNTLSKFARQLSGAPKCYRLDTVRAYQQTLTELKG
ncbi:ACP S-malonyltransferase [Ligilactobacillus faecis]|uniref:ACP S-malonyltransferase n=1 Tax=Ligilactobacillus faecis TaxID=762833 RepID=UPI0024692560|nr:ACP S-malonyltransferase [Ligilactobacillus faecis]WGN89100.1 ACP S-malonyltransferase [Ligilactobacillus faecis]